MRSRQKDVGQLIALVSDVVSTGAAPLIPQTTARRFGVRVYLAATSAGAAAARQEHETPGDDTKTTEAYGIWQHETSLSKRPDRSRPGQSETIAGAKTIAQK